MLKLALILLVSNKALGDSCPVLNVTYQNLDDDAIPKSFRVYQYQEVDPIVMSPFYGIGDDFSNLQFIENLLKVCCSYVAEKHTNSSIPITDFILNLIRHKKNLLDNRIHLTYSENNGDIFCGAVAKMTEIWMIDHSPCFVSLYGCKIAEINGKFKRFEGVLILRDYPINVNQCSYNDLRYTYNVLQNQTGVALSSLTNKSFENVNMARKYCQAERARFYYCTTLDIDNLKKSINNVYFVLISFGVGIFFVDYLYETFSGLNYFL